MGGITKRVVFADGRARRPGRSATTATRGPKYRGAVLKNFESLHLDAILLTFLNVQPVQCCQRIRDVVIWMQMVEMEEEIRGGN